METDLFNYVSIRIFFQLGEDKLLYLIVFFSKNLNLTKYIYEIYNKKLLAIIYCFEIWRPKFEDIRVLIKVITNYKNEE